MHTLIYTHTHTLLSEHGNNLITTLLPISSCDLVEITWVRNTLACFLLLVISASVLRRVRDMELYQCVYPLKKSSGKTLKPSNTEVRKNIEV